MADNKMNLSDLLETHRRDRERLAWEGTFRDYFELVTQNPNISKLSHARVCDMVLASGVEKMWMAMQPILSWRTRTVYAYEALLRTDEPTLRNPLDFLDAAERLGRTRDLGRIVAVPRDRARVHRPRQLASHVQPDAGA